jgi:hypothetical protein
MGYIFISYDHDDEAFADRLVESLAQYYEIWIDEEGIDGGAEWIEALDKAIRGCSVFVVLISPESNQSDWVIREIIRAEETDKHRIPILIEGDDLPLPLVNVQYIDFRASFDAGLRDLLEALTKHLDPKAHMQEQARLLIGTGVAAYLSGDPPKANHLIGQGLALDPEIAGSVDDFWSRLRARERSDLAAALMDNIRVVERTETLTDGIYTDGKTAYKWTLELDAPDDVLNQIDSVRYELHPTFQPPYQIVRARETRFRLTRVGWGVFQVGVTVTFKDNTVGETVHQLTFETD